MQQHRFEFDEAPSVEAVASQLSKLCLKFNGYDKDGREDDGGLAMSRPVGVAFLLAGLDRGEPVLYHLGPSGTFFIPQFRSFIFFFSWLSYYSLDNCPPWGKTPSAPCRVEFFAGARLVPMTNI